MVMIQGYIHKLWRILLVISKSGYKEFPTNIKVFVFFVLLKMLKFMFFKRFFCLYVWDILRIKKEDLKVVRLLGLNIDIWKKSRTKVKFSVFLDNFLYNFSFWRFDYKWVIKTRHPLYLLKCISNFGFHSIIQNEWILREFIKREKLDVPRVLAIFPLSK